MDDIDRDILRQVAGHTARFRLQNQFNIDATLRDARDHDIKFRTAKCCGKVFNTREAKTAHENFRFMNVTTRYCEK